jgi:hypothetical protein
VLLVAAACGDGGGAGSADAPLAAVDGAPTASDAAPDAPTNPARLWLAPINGSETNLQLLDHEPPPF